MKHMVQAVLRKRIVLALVVGAIIFTSVYAFAATLSVTSNNLSAGNAAVASCAASVTASYTVAYDSTLPGYRVATVAISGLGSCTAGLTVSVDLTNTSNVSLAHVTTTLVAADITAGKATLTVGGSVSAATVTGVSVAVNG